MSAPTPLPAPPLPESLLPGPLEPGVRSGDSRVQVLVALPRHSPLEGALDYLTQAPLPVGTLVRVPLGRRLVLGVVWGGEQAGAMDSGVVLKAVAEVLDAVPPLPPAWCRLVDFAARYYQRSVGELALAALPIDLRDLDGGQLARRLTRLGKRLAPPAPPKRARGRRGVAAATVPLEASVVAIDPPPLPAPQWPTLSADQAEVLARLFEGAQPSPAWPVLPPVLLHGVTGSGKTEVYLRAADRVLGQGRQVLVLVPEINLTPQLEQRFAERFPQRRIVSLHSGLTPAQRLQNWLQAHAGQADLVLGTRMAVFAPLPDIGLIVVDEEHDPSYKQQEGARYSARDLAIYRARLEGARVVLGSATPSIESWLNAQPEQARYRLLPMPRRIGDGVLPRVRLIDMRDVIARHGKQALWNMPIAPPLQAAIAERLERGEQSLLLLNRRGYAPVLHCTSCGWKSECPHCSAWRVFHKSDRTLRCHHCGVAERVPRACPACGDPDIQPMGRGTERLEEQLAALFPAARIGRIDADTTRAKGSLESQLASVHAGEVDILVGTQMVAKGHDFRRMTLVAAIQADAALFSSDFRAAERLFALLMQAGGRAGRDAAQADRSEMWIQTWNPAHPLYQALIAHDYEAFARSQLAERAQAGLPPYAHLALLRAEARTQAAAQAFLAAAAALGQTQADALGEAGDGLLLYPAVPAAIQRVADVERAQMLVEAPRRATLQRFLAGWVPQLASLSTGEQRVLRWAVDVDPLAI